MTPRDPFQKLLADEIEGLIKNLPQSLIGGAPVSPLLFQPTPEGGRLVYLDKLESARNPVWIDPGQNSIKFIFNDNEEAPWIASKGPVTEENLSEYSDNNSAEMRSRLAKLDRDRYGSEYFDSTGATKIGTVYRMHHIFPGPLFLDGDVEWWKRLPRLGEIYSLGTKLDHHDLLLICAIEIGNRAQRNRLTTLLDHDTFLGRTAYEIAGLTATGDGSVGDEQFMFLVAHLLLCHHWLFPFDPIALNIFASLVCDADEVLKLHGWPAHGLTNVKAYSQPSEYLPKLYKDLEYLISACATSEKPVNQLSLKKMRDRLREHVLPVLGLLCGTPRYMTRCFRKLSINDEFTTSWTHVGIQVSGKWEDYFGTAPLLPAFLKRQVEANDGSCDREAAAQFVQNLSPTHQLKTIRWNKMEVTRACGSDILDSASMNDWVTKYSRGRCLLKILDDRAATREGS